MTSLTKTHTKSVSQARPAAAAKAAARLVYLDTIRVVLIALVIALHTAITYGASGDWTYEDPAQTELSGILLTFVTTMVQAFSLGLYFFISGYFTPRSYDRKGIGAFWKDRLLRLGIPMLAYTFIFSIITRYAASIGNGQTAQSFWQYFGQNFLREADEGPTWFIFALLVFLVGYTLWRLVTRAGKLEWIKQLGVPGRKEILAFGALVSALMFLIGLKSRIGDTVEVFGIFNLMTIFFAQYVLFFVAGILAYRNDWLARFDGKDLRFWAWLTAGLLLMMPVLFFLGGAAGGSVDVFIGGLHWQAAVFMLWIGLFSVSVSMTLILWLRDRKQPQSRLMAFAGPNSYAVYLIHPLILVPLTVLFTPVTLDPLLKYVIVVPVVVGLCFLAAELLRRIPGMKTIL